MKKYCVILFACALASLASVYAQDMIQVKVPFSFIVADTTLPAGEYRVEKLASNLIQIRGLENAEFANSMATPVKRATIAEVITKWHPGASSENANIGSRPKNAPRSENTSAEYCVVFHRYGDTYFLSNVWTQYRGQELYVSRVERTYQAADTSRKAETVVLAAMVAR